MSDQIVNNEYLNNITNNMLTMKNIAKIPCYYNENKRSKNNADNNDKKVNKINIDHNNTYYPKERDQLFWIFYIILNNLDRYEMINNYFTTEKETKYEMVEKLRTRKDIFKTTKISRNKIEDELANKPKISLSCIKVLCIFYDINIFYIDNKKYYEIITNENNNYYTIEKKNNKYGLKQNISKDNIDYYREHFWKLESLEKPIKAISSYKISDLKEICKKININCDNMNKQKMYQEILTVL